MSLLNDRTGGLVFCRNHQIVFSSLVSTFFVWSAKRPDVGGQVIFIIHESQTMYEYIKVYFKKVHVTHFSEVKPAVVFSFMVVSWVQSISWFIVTASV